MLLLLTSIGLGTRDVEVDDYVDDVDASSFLHNFAEMWKFHEIPNSIWAEARLPCNEARECTGLWRRCGLHATSRILRSADRPLKRLFFPLVSTDVLRLPQRWYSCLYHLRRSCRPQLQAQKKLLHIAENVNMPINQY